MRLSECFRRALDQLGYEQRSGPGVGPALSALLQELDELEDRVSKVVQRLAAVEAKVKDK